MITSWSDVTYHLRETEHPLVVLHEETKCISLYWPGYHDHCGRGFTIQLLPAHLPELRKAVMLLELIEAQQLAAAEVAAEGEQT